MKGKISSLPSGKQFGFIEPEGGGQKVFFLYSLVENKGLMGEGSEVDYEPVEPTPEKGPKAQKVKVLTKGGGEIRKGIPAPPAVETAKVPSDIEVEAVLDPDANGYFAVTVRTRKKGKPASRAFRIASPIKITVFGWNEEGQLVQVNPSSLQTPKTGTMQTFITFDGPQTTLPFVLDDGTKALVDLVK